MDSETDSTKSHTESEEDVGCYFLEPASSPYNITEKVLQANVDLYSTLYGNNEKTLKVKFRDELVSFEPDLTDDDINSIESDQPEVSIDSRPTILEYKAVINSDINIFDIEEEEGEVFEEEEVIDDTETSDCDECVKHIEHNYKTEIKNSSDENEERDSETITEQSSKHCSKRKKSNKYNPALLNPREIHCKEHCIDRLDFDLSTSIKKLEIHEKVDLPPLQLLRRKCCDEVKEKFHTNLPNYMGLRSEYGLTSRQLDKKEKQAETIRLREQMRCKLLEEYRQRKIQQNEEVFVQWLKEVAKRKSGNKSVNNKAQKSDNQRRVSSAGYSVPTKINKKIKQRPKTAEERKKKTNKGQRRRPHTTHSCVYIEVPQSLLEQGLSIGDLTITSSKLRKRKIHILAVS